MSILIADDDEDDKFLIQTAFKEKGYTTELTFINNGIELMNYLNNSSKDHLPAIIILDLNMPGKNGLETLKEIKQNNLFKRIPIIVFTTTNDEEDLKVCYNLGANTCIIKPRTFDKFLHTVQQVYSYWMLTAALV